MRALHLGPQLKTILKNVGFVASSNLLSRFLMIFVQAGLGRFWGQAGLGGYSTAVAVSVYFVFLVDCGVAPRLVREGAVAPQALGEEYARALGLKLISAALSILLIAILYFVLNYEPWVRELCVWLSLGAVVRSFTYLNESVFRARERFELESILQLVYAVLFVGPVCLLLLWGYSARAVGIATLMAYIVQWLVSIFWIRRFVPISFRWPPHWATLVQAFPYVTTSLAVTAFAQIDILILSFITTQEIVGSYTAVSRLLLVVGTMSGMAVSAILPAATRIYTTATTERYCNIVNETLRFALHFGGAATLGALVCAPYLIKLVYGAEFQGLYPLLQLGSVYLVIRFLNSVLESLLTACGRQSQRARALGIGFLATTVFVFGFVPLFGIWGAVLALVLSESVLLLCLGFFMQDFLSPRLLRRAAFCFFLSSGGAVAIYFSLTQTSLTLTRSIVGTLAAFVLYLSVLVFSGEAKKSVQFFGIVRSRG